MRKLLAVVTGIVVLCGCASTPLDTSIEDEVLATMRDYVAAMQAGDADAILAFYSEDWEDNDGSTKDSLRAGYQSRSDKGKDKGKNEDKGGYVGGEYDLSLAEVTVDGDIVAVAPVTFTSSKGSISHRHKLKKEGGGVWRLVHTEEGINWEIIPLDSEGRRRLVADYASALAARTLRDKILNDPSRPGYHFVMPEGVASPFDPDGAIYWKGRYHLFYIFQDTRSGKKMDHWGHVSSKDLFHWRHHPTGLLYGMYSGNCFINQDGAPTICYHQVGQGNAMAVALDDDLNEWKKLDSNPITPKTQEGEEHHGKYRSWDPFGWFEDDTYYLGEWKNEQFYPESHAQMSWVDNSFFAPESLEDDKGRRTAIRCRFGRGRHWRQQPRTVDRYGKCRGVRIWRQGVCFARRAGGDLGFLRRCGRQAEG
jgi:ketosteroid isomerase-like protein